MTTTQVQSKVRLAIKWSRKGILTIFVAYLIMLVGFREFNLSPVDLAVAPYQYSILDWELTHLPDKWTHKIAGLWSINSSATQDEKLTQVKEFFDLGINLHRLEQQTIFPNRPSEGQSPQPEVYPNLIENIDNIKERREFLQSSVEETIERAIANTLKEEGLSILIGVFPPVDTVFTRSPHVLILSPRDRIERQQDILLNPGLSVLDKEEIEDQIVFEKQDLSVYIEDTGGVAVYPSVVSDIFGLQNATDISSHEWIHHWLLFKPLGQSFWNNTEMASLNETVATLAGKELGDKVFTSLTGKEVNQTMPSPTKPLDSDSFDFRAEMQQTRMQAEALLSAGNIEEAEAYMEERRQLFVANQYLIRKLNQAYFAFHGTYAASAASISPIGDQVQELRDRSESLENFLNTVSRFSTYQEFLDHLEKLRELEEEKNDNK